jgi:hypothetical protein
MRDETLRLFESARKEDAACFVFLKKQVVAISTHCCYNFIMCVSSKILPQGITW